MKKNNLEISKTPELHEIDEFIKQEIETDTNDVVTSDVVMESEDNTNTVVLSQNVVYRDNHTYWVGYDKNTKKLSTLFGFPFACIENLNTNDPNIVMVKIGRITEMDYKKLKAACGTFSTSAYMNEKTKSIYYRRIFIEYDKSVTLKKPAKHCISEDNIIRFKVFCYDDNDVHVDDENIIITIKNMATRDAEKKVSDVEINNNPNTVREVRVKSGETIELKLNSKGVHNFRVSMFIPENPYQPMNHYFTAFKSEES